MPRRFVSFNVARTRHAKLMVLVIPVSASMLLLEALDYLRLTRAIPSTDSILHISPHSITTITITLVVRICLREREMFIKRRDQYCSPNQYKQSTQRTLSNTSPLPVIIHRPSRLALQAYLAMNALWNLSMSTTYSSTPGLRAVVRKWTWPSTWPKPSPGTRQIPVSSVTERERGGCQ